jgi:hypothetical protein
MTRQMTTDDERALVNHWSMFGSYSICHKLGRKWFVDFRGFGFPTAFKTRDAAEKMGTAWVLEVAHRRPA